MCNADESSERPRKIEGQVLDWTDDRLLRLFDRYNRKYWSGKLSGYRVSLATPSGCTGQCNYREKLIEIDSDQHRTDRELRATLLHEMAHAASRSGHTVPFFGELERLLRRSAPVTVDAAEAGHAKILADIVPKRFPLLRAKMVRPRIDGR